MITRFLAFISLFTFLSSVFAQNKTFNAIRTHQPPKIDGIIETSWNECPVINGFKQKNPYFDQAPLYDTDIRIMYDDKAIYIATFCKDLHPDSILKQLGNRDDENLNADYFFIGFDTYNKQQDAYIFGVTASGVQFDKRVKDDSYNAVWQSSVIICDTGWITEIKIPYSALRFPNSQNQQWRFQCVRYIRRNRQESRLILEPREANNSLLYWANLEGIENINAPLRLSFTPYISSGIKTEKQKGSKTEISKLFNGGMDLKYGINESYTLDLTLLPDFSQVQSDNKYKNLSAYETVFNEQRPFFKESVDLFNKGNIFCSRRIGRTPRNFYSVINFLDSNEIISKNPQQTQLINAFKISGRNKNGLAIGVLNAITANTYAQASSTINNSSRDILTEPWANYNVFVIDQDFKGGNNAFITNTNFLRSKSQYNSNVTATGFTLLNKPKTYQLSLSGGISQFYYINGKSNSDLPRNGYKSSINLNKVNGNFKFGISSGLMDNHFNANDVGLTQSKDYLNNTAYLNYNHYSPTKLLLNYGINIVYMQNYQWSSLHSKISRTELSLWGTTKNYTSIWTGGFTDLQSGYDFDEPRLPNFVFNVGKYKNVRFGISTDYRKPFAIDISTAYFYNSTYHSKSNYIEISPLFRINDHLSFRYQFEGDFAKDDVGFASLDSTNSFPIFGKRDISTLTNSITGNYLIKNDLSISLKFRYYWSQGDYNQIFRLNNNGVFENTLSNYSPNIFNYNFNSLTVDLVFSWQFAPGSNMMLIWKNELFEEGTKLYNSYFENLKYLNNYPTNNTFLLKILYYLDYEYLFKKKT